MRPVCDGGPGRGFRKGCKPNSVCRGRANTRAGENHLSERPVPGIRTAVAALARAAPKIPYLALLPMGFSVPRQLPGGRWALTPPFHPCRAPLPERRRFAFLWHFPSAATFVATARVYPAVVRLAPAATGYAASRPVEFGLSSPGARERAGSDSPPFQNRGDDSRLRAAIQGDATSRAHPTLPSGLLTERRATRSGQIVPVCCASSTAPLPATGRPCFGPPRRAEWPGRTIRVRLLR